MNAVTPWGWGYDLAREDLTWFFACGEAAMGLHAAGLEPGSGPAVWDAARIHAAHMSKRTPEHHAAVARRAFVAGCLNETPTAYRCVLIDVFRPFGAARTTWQTRAAFSLHGQCLLALAMRMPAAHKAFAVAHKTLVVPPSSVMLRYLELEVSRQQSSALPRRHRLYAAVLEAETLTRSALEAYDAVRQERLAAAAAEREERLQRELAALHVRLWGRA